MMRFRKWWKEHTSNAWVNKEKTHIAKPRSDSAPEACHGPAIGDAPADIQKQTPRSTSTGPTMFQSPREVTIHGGNLTSVNTVAPLVRQQVECSARLEKVLVARHQRERTTPSLEELVSVLKIISNEFKMNIYVLDGVNEAKGDVQVKLSGGALFHHLPSVEGARRHLLPH